MTGGLSLRARLGLSVALVVAMIVGATTLVENRIVVGVLETEALNAAAATALGAAAELTERESSPGTAELEEILGDFTRAVPALESLTVTRAPGPGTPASEPGVVSTEGNPSAEGLALAARAIEARALVSSGSRSAAFLFVAIPLE